MCIRDRGSLEGLKMCFIGDGNNMMNSLIVGCLKVGMSVSVACPEGYRPPREILEFASQYNCFELTDSPLQAAKDADVVITDVWTSMGQEEERAKREAAFKGYCVDEKLMAQAKPCLLYTSINATDCADYLVAEKGLPFRDAYKITGELVALCIAKGLTLETLPLEEYQKICDSFDEGVYQAISLEKCVGGRRVLGGPAPENVRFQARRVLELVGKE